MKSLYSLNCIVYYYDPPPLNFASLNVEGHLRVWCTSYIILFHRLISIIKIPQAYTFSRLLISLLYFFYTFLKLYLLLRARESKYSFKKKDSKYYFFLRHHLHYLYISSLTSPLLFTTSCVWFHISLVCILYNSQMNELNTLHCIAHLFIYFFLTSLLFFFYIKPIFFIFYLFY